MGVPQADSAPPAPIPPPITYPSNHLQPKAINTPLTHKPRQPAQRDPPHPTTYRLPTAPGATHPGKQQHKTPAISATPPAGRRRGATHHSPKNTPRSPSHHVQTPHPSAEHPQGGVISSNPEYSDIDNIFTIHPIHPPMDLIGQNFASAPEQRQSFPVILSPYGFAYRDASDSKHTAAWRTPAPPAQRSLATRWCTQPIPNIHPPHPEGPTRPPNTPQPPHPRTHSVSNSHPVVSPATFRDSEGPTQPAAERSNAAHPANHPPQTHPWRNIHPLPPAVW